MDTPLSEQGRRQSELAGRKLASCETISQIYCSDLSRAVQVSGHLQLLQYLLFVCVGVCVCVCVVEDCGVDQTGAGISRGALAGCKTERKGVCVCFVKV